ncbi:hypothetical protein CASFOL_000660 [Castilleja foliolosa]|uniref:Uncharacterized protein n=1 Tax=Castilleja foliolosa TaxID=1961234 RepID=A0ABD3EP51_9LAMI
MIILQLDSENPQERQLTKTTTLYLKSRSHGLETIGLMFSIRTRILAPIQRPFCIVYGSAELAAVGVSGAVFNLVSKLFNVPLLNITTSFVAEEQASVMKAADEYSQTAKDQQSKIFLPSVSNAIMLAAALGIIEAIALSTGSSFLMNTMGISVLYLTAIILLWKLNDEVQLISPSINGQRVVRYLKSAVLITTTLATSIAHQICFEVWLALSLLNDALALAGQTLLASDYSQGNFGVARQPPGDLQSATIGLIMGTALGIVLFLGFGALSSLFSTDSEVLQIARSGTLFVAGSQPMNAIAFVLDGLYYGISDFGFAAYSINGACWTNLFSFLTGNCTFIWSCWCMGWPFSIYDFASSSWSLEVKHQKWTVEIFAA